MDLFAEVYQIERTSPLLQGCTQWGQARVVHPTWAQQESRGRVNDLQTIPRTHPECVEHHGGKGHLAFAGDFRDHGGTLHHLTIFVKW